MAPKRSKSSVSSAAAAPGGSRSWESALISAQLEEERWKVSIAFVVENQQEDRLHTRALSQAVSLPQRRLFSLVSWDTVLQQVYELGNPKTKKMKDSPQYYEVTEAAKLLLDNGEKLPLPLIAKLLKFQFLCIKQKDLQRREAERKDANLQDKTTKSVKAKPSSAKGSGKTKAKKAPEAPATIKKTTTLRRRGEEEDTNVYIDDEPDDGPQHYIIVLGVYQPQILALLADLGVHVSSVIRVSSQNYRSLPVHQEDPDSAPDVVEAERQRKETVTKSLEFFWKYLEPVLNAGKMESPLSQVARLLYLVKESAQPTDWSDGDGQLAYATEVYENIACLVYENIACLMYDCLDWRRQHQYYLENMRIIHVPAVGEEKVPEWPASASEAPAALYPSSPTGRKKGQQDEIPHSVSLPNLTPVHVEVEVEALALDVDMRFYNDLLSDVPEELQSVPVIVHCMLEQVVATEKDLVPPSEIVPNHRVDGLDPTIADHMISVLDSLSLSEKEKKNLYNTFLVQDKDEKTEESKGPHLLSYHDKITERTYQVQAPKTFNPIKIEKMMLNELPIVQHLPILQLPPEISSRRLAHIHELMHYCSTGRLSLEELTRAFKLLTFESLTLSGFDEFGELEGPGKMLGEDVHIPWDNPAAFARDVSRTWSVRKMYEKRPCDASGGACVEVQDAEEENKDSRGSETPRADLIDIHRTQKRCLSDWCYTEHYDPALLTQVLHDAGEAYTCMDFYYYTQDNCLLLILHNPMNPFRQSQASWDMALHSNVSFRNYLELVADSISNWVQEKEAKYQEEKSERELEALKQAQALQDSSVVSKDVSPSRKKGRKSTSPEKSKSPRGSGSRPGSRAEEASTPDPDKDLFLREDSLKAWKIEQDRLKEEERLKLEKKNTKLSKSGGRNKGRSRERTGSREGKGSPSSNKNMKENNADEEQKSQGPVPGTADSPAAPCKDDVRFIGYDMGDSLIQVSGSTRCLYPTDGGQIQVEHTHFEKGSSFVKLKLLKDGHNFLIHIINPKTPDKQEDIVQVEQGGTPVSRNRSVCEFGSFSATLQSRIQLSLSHYGASGRGPEEWDPELEAVLAFPSVHTPSIIPTPPSQPPATPSGKSRKSPRAARMKTPQVAAPEEAPRNPEGKAEPVIPPVPTPTKPVPDTPFQALNVSYPNGLLLTFLREDQAGVVAGDGCIAQRLLIRQSYPVKVKNARLCNHTRDPEISEASRIITAEGAVIRCMLDGSTQVLFPDGTVSQSPDSGPVVEQRPSGLSHTEVPETPSADSLPVVPSSASLDLREPAPEPRKGKGGYKVPPPPRPEVPEPPPADSLPATTSVPVVEPGTWITTTPSGVQIGTRGYERLQLPSLRTYQATDPVNRTVMSTREDQVVMVVRTDGTVIVEHADATRITTFYQDVDVPLPGQYEETGEIPQSIRKRVKFIRVERAEFTTMILNCEENTACAVSGDGTEILAKPQGAYLVYPPNSGCLSINHEGRAVYSPRPSYSDQLPHRQEDLPPASYIMSHTQNVICEALDPEGNLFQVMVDGSTSVVISGSDACEEEESEEREKTPDTTIQRPPEVYDLHTPRFFIINADGSGSELLRNREVEDYLAACYCEPATAVLREPTQEMPGVQSITVLQPFSETSPWVMKKELNDIVPPNLLSRSWNTFPSVERKTPGPPLGVGVWKGLQIGSRDVNRVRPPVLKCPNVLKIRQLHLYEPVSKEVREKLEQSLKEYIDKVLKKEKESQEIDIKEPRTVEEKEHATDLLKLVLSLTDFQDSPDPPRLERIQGDIASLYESAVSPPPPPPPPVAGPARSVRDRNKLRLELTQHKEQLEAMRKRHIPPYFQSELGLEFLRNQTPDMERLSRQLPPIPRAQEEEEAMEEEQTFSSEDEESAPADSGNAVCAAGAHDEATWMSRSPDTAENFMWPEMTSTQRHRPRSHSLDVDVTGQPRREKVKLPVSILSGKPSSVPNAKFAAVEDPVRRRVLTASTSAPANNVVKRVPRGFHLTPAAVQFGVLREGYTYAMTVTVKNIGVDFCRYRVKPPPPSSGLRVTYTPGPVAAGMQTRFGVELFAMAIGLEGPEGVAEYSHSIEIQSEVETLFLPVTATVLTEEVYERRAEAEPPRRLAPGVRLLSTNPNDRAEILRPSKERPSDF
ncbi:sperm-associated antigen 17 [Pseudophryne corroboree]|uniref:sperm-associated antigen 17 n=1 Tax=Pseudophryne corroboree TaxID=495146 RepID=UPI00308211A5